MKLFIPGRIKVSVIFLMILLFPSLHVAASEAEQDSMAFFRDVISTMNATKSFSVHIEKEFDVIMMDGAKVQYGGALDLLVQRDGAMHLNYGDDVSAKEVWYDGSSLTIIDHLTNIYMQVPASGKVGNMLADVTERYGLELPLAPLLRRNDDGNSRDFEEKVQSSTYLGLHDALGEPCHHVLYRGENIDLQIWVSTGDRPLLQKMIVTFWQIEGTPQQTLEFSEWNLKARAKRKTFKAKFPDSAIRTELLPVGEKLP